MNKNQTIRYLLILMSVLVFSGCGRQEGVFYDGSGQIRQDGAVQEQSGREQNDRNPNSREQNDREEAGAEGQSIPEAQQAGVCFIHICGAVVCPGVYQVPEGSRLFEAISQAGGLSEDACDYMVNQAQIVTDGMQIYIPTVQEAETAGSAYPAAGSGAAEWVTGREQAQDGSVNLNSATKELLMTLPGIGESRAEAIIAYRQEHGGFSNVEELMNVSGIKQGVYDRLKERIRV